MTMQLNSQKILVTGATGAVGPTLVRHLLDAGAEVRVLARPSSDLSALPLERIEVVHGDITEPAEVATAVTDQSIVMHLAALLHINNPGPELADRYEKVNVAGTHNVVCAARAAGAKRVILFSSICVYGPTDGGRPVSEATDLSHLPDGDDTLYARTKRRAERVALEILDEHERPFVTVLRLASVYGPQMKGNYVRLIKALQRGLYRSIGPGWNRRTLVHVDDVARAALCAAVHPAAAGKIYNVTDGQPHTMGEITAAIADALGRRSPRLYLPERPIRLALNGVEHGQRLLGRTPRIGTFTLDKLLEDVAVDGRRIQQELGFAPQWGLSDGWRQAVLEMMNDDR